MNWNWNWIAEILLLATAVRYPSAALADLAEVIGMTWQKAAGRQRC